MPQIPYVWDTPSISIDSKDPKEIVGEILTKRGLTDATEQQLFTNPKDPFDFSAADVQIDAQQLLAAVTRIKRAIENQESVVVYADYDADGVTAGAILWETLYALGGKVMPYIPHRIDEGYGLSIKGIDTVKAQYNPALIITVDNGISAAEEVAYAQSLGIDVIVTDHHTHAAIKPDTCTVHTTVMSGSAVAWFVAHTVIGAMAAKKDVSYLDQELLALATIGTVADLLPLTGINRSIVHRGLSVLKNTNRTGLQAMYTEAGLNTHRLSTYDVSHMLAPRINALGRMEHALDALRLLCTKDSKRAEELAARLGAVNRERQQATTDATQLALSLVEQGKLYEQGSLLIVSDALFNQGIIGLVAGKLVESYYLPAIVFSLNGDLAKASARSISGYNIIEAIRTAGDLLVSAGGHPMAAGVSIDVKNLPKFSDLLSTHAAATITPDMRKKRLKIDAEVLLSSLSEPLYEHIQMLSPFGMGNPEPVLMTRKVRVLDVRTIGLDGKHLKFRLADTEGTIVEAVAFSQGYRYPEFRPNILLDVVYVLSMNVWQGRKTLQLVVKDFRVSE